MKQKRKELFEPITNPLSKPIGFTIVQPLLLFHSSLAGESIWPILRNFDLGVK